MSELDDTLLAHLQAETEAFARFLEILEAERQALAHNSITTLSELSQTKLQQVELLNRLGNDRLRTLNALGYIANPSGMEQWLNMSGGTARSAWENLLEVGRKAHEANQVNGKLILQTMQFHQQALAVLLSAANQVSLYGADGQPQGPFSGAGGRSIIGSA